MERVFREIEKTYRKVSLKSMAIEARPEALVPEYVILPILEELKKIRETLEKESLTERRK